ncbi:hypothetical protein ACIRPH_08510 [Nocardiopsis sp. NPDC101807]|uniref:hypothetical protein n=1 Tax=Nocardiopsis sp. NPDC101807 TaxID=3364339 RepID=UPI0038079EDA
MPLDHTMSDSSRKAIEVLTGIQVPKAGIANLGRASEIYTALDQRLAVLEDLFDLSRKHARRHFDGNTADRYERSLDQFTRGENNYVGSARDNSNVMSAELFKARANVEYMHMMVIGQFVQLLAEIAWAIAMAKFTFGASLKWIPVFKAIRSLAMRRILTWLLITVPGHQIISQIFASMDSIIQRIQIGRGTRHHRDNALTESAHKGAVIEGALSAVFSAGMDGLFSKHLSDLFTNGLKHLNDLPDPPPLIKTGPDGPPPAGPPTGPPVRETPDGPPPGPPSGPPDGPPAGPVRDDPPPLNRDTDTPPPGGGGGPDGPPTRPKDDPPAGPVKDDPPTAPVKDDPAPTPAPKDTPGSVPAPKDTPPASPSLNKDLAEVFGRHNDEFLTPYNPASPVGAGAFDNATKAAAARNDFAEVFARNFGDHLGESAARDLGRDYATTLARHWNDPDLGRHLRDTIGDRLPPHMRDHLADVPVNLNKPLGEYFSTTGAYTQQVGGSIGTGALEGYLGEGLGSMADGRGWEASGYSATAGATQAGIQQGATDGILHGTELFKDRDRPDLDTSTVPPRTQSESPTGTGPEVAGSENGRPPAQSGSERWEGDPGGQGGDPGGPDRGAGRGDGEGRGQDGRPDREGPAATASSYDRDDLSDIDDVPDLVSDTDSDSVFGDDGSEFGDPGDRDQPNNDTVRVHQDEDVRTPYPDPFKTPDTGKDAFGTTEAKHPGFTDTAFPGLGDDLFHPGMNDGPLTVNFLNAIVPDNPTTATPPPGAEQTAPPGNTPDTGNGTNPADRSAPEPEQHTPAPVAVAPPIGQAAPPPTTAPQNTTTDNNQRPTPAERDNGGRPSQRANDIRTPGPSPQRSAFNDTPQATTESAPPAPQTTTTGDPTGLDAPAPSTDDQRANPDTAPDPEHPTSPAEVPLPPSPATESDGRQDTDTTTESGPPRHTHDTDRTPSDRDGEESDQRDEATPRDDDRPQDSDEDQAEEGGVPAGEQAEDRSGDGEDKRDDQEHHPRDQNDDASDRKDDKDDKKDGEEGGDEKRADDEPTPEEPSVDGEDGKQQDGEKSTDSAPDPDPQEHHDPPNAAKTENVPAPEVTAKSPTEDSSGEAPSRERDADREQAPAEHGGTDATATSRDRAPETGPTPEPDPDYAGTVVADRNTPHDIGYLLNSSLVNASMVHAQHLDAFVDGTLGNDDVTAPDGVRDEVRDRISAQQDKNMSTFFTPDGYSTEVKGDDGSVWTARVKLTLPEGNFYHASSEAVPGTKTPQAKMAAEVGGSAAFEGSGGHGGNKAFNLGFTLSPLMLGATGVGDVGPRAIFSFTSSTRQRQTAAGTTVTFESATAYEATGTPEVYAADLGMDFVLERTSPPPTSSPTSDTALRDGTAPSTDRSPGVRDASGRERTPAPPKEEDATAANPRVQRRTHSSNGLALILPGKVTPHKGPATITLSDPLSGGPAGKDGTSPARTPHPNVANGQPISLGGFRERAGKNGEETQDVPSLADWVADKVAPSGAGPGRFKRAARHLLPAVGKERRQQLLEHVQNQTKKKFSDEVMLEVLPKSTRKAHSITLTTPDGEQRRVKIRSVPISYVAKPSSLPEGGQNRSGKSEHETSHSLQKHKITGGTGGAGVGLDVGFPGTNHGVRFDIVSGEGGQRHRSTEESGTGNSGSVKRTSTDRAGSGVYEVTRNYYVHFQGDPEPHRLTGTSLEILTDADAWAISGRTPPAPKGEGGANGQDRTTDDHDAETDASRDRSTPETAPGPDTRTDDAGAEPTGTSAPDAQDSRRERTGEDRTALPREIVPKDFTWPTNDLYHGQGKDPQRTVYDQILHQVLTGIAKHRPGLVMPDITSDSKNFNRPPGEGSRSFSEVLRSQRLLSRDRRTAESNTAKIEKAISDAGFLGGLDSLRDNGISVTLSETARTGASSGKSTGTYLLHAPTITLRIRADFSDVRHSGGGKDGQESRGGEKSKDGQENRGAEENKDGQENKGAEESKVGKKELSFKYGGASSYSSGTGTQDRSTAKGTSGAYARESGAADANGYAPRSGRASASTTLSKTTSGSRNLSTKVQSEHGVSYPEDTVDTWTATAMISARLYEHDDIGMAKPDAKTKPVSERGIALFDPVETLFTGETPKTPSDAARAGQDPSGRQKDAPQDRTTADPEPPGERPERSDRRRDRFMRPFRTETGDAADEGGRPADTPSRSGAPQADQAGAGRSREPGSPEVVVITPMSSEDAENMLRGFTTAAPGNVRQRPGGLVRATKRFANRFHTEPDGTDRGRAPTDRADADRRTTPQPNTTTRTDATTRPTTRTGDTGEGTTARPTVQTDGAVQDSTGTTDQRTKEQRQADTLLDTGATFEYTATTFTTEDGQVNSLVEAYYGNFPNRAPWDTNGPGRQSDFQRFKRSLEELRLERDLKKLRSYLTRSEGNRQYMEHVLSEDNVRNNPQTYSSSGLRANTELTGDLRSGHNARITSATRYELGAITRLEQSDAALSWEDKTSYEVSTNTSTKKDLTVQGAGGGRYNPNPAEPTAGGARHSEAPNSASDPQVHLGPALSKSIFDWTVSDKPSQKFSETIGFSPGIDKSYKFHASGLVKQAVEFSRNLRHGPPVPHSPRYRGWQAHLDDLTRGLLHVRDAQQSGLVEDRVVEEADGTLSRAPQPEPERPGQARVRPGAEDSGKFMRPPSADRALKDLADDLAASGWELTGKSRSDILDALTSYRGLRPNSGPPLAVRIKPVGHSVFKGNTTSTTPVAFDAVVNLKLDTGNPQVDYIGGKTLFKQQQTLETGNKGQQERAGNAGAGVQEAVMPPLPHAEGGQPSSGEPGPASRPTMMGVFGDQSGARAHNEGVAVKDSDKRTVQVSMDLPYAKMSMDSRLTIDLEIPEKQGFSTTLAWEGLEKDERRSFRGEGDAGTVKALYPAFSIDLPRAGDGVDGSTDTSGDDRPAPPGDRAPLSRDTAADPRSTQDGGGADRTGAAPQTPPRSTPDDTATTRTEGRSADRTPPPPAPENPSSDTHASLEQMMRDWTSGRSPVGGRDIRDAVVMPTAIVPDGQDPRDTAHVVVARSLGWTPPPDAVVDGRYTPEAVKEARALVADKIGLNVRNDAIDHSLNPLSLKSLFLQALDPGGVEMIRMGRTRLAVRALPDLRSGKIIDYNPDVRLSDSSESEQTVTSSQSTSDSLAANLDNMPAGRVGGTDQPPRGGLFGAAGAGDSTSAGGAASQDTKAKDPSTTTRTRTGPGYLVEFDTTWGVGAKTELRGAWYKRAAKSIGHKSADTGRAAVDRVRRGLGREPRHTSPREKPARWQRGEVNTKVRTWISHGDAVKLGIIAPDGVDHLKPLMDRIAETQETLATAEKDYLDAREPLDRAAAKVVGTRNALDGARGEGAGRDGATDGAPSGPERAEGAGRTLSEPGGQRTEDARRAREEYDKLQDAHDKSLDAFNTALREWADALRALRRGFTDTPAVQPPLTGGTSSDEGDDKGKAPERPADGGPSTEPTGGDGGTETGQDGAPPTEADSGRALRDRLGEAFGITLTGTGEDSGRSFDHESEDGDALVPESYRAQVHEEDDTAPLLPPASAPKGTGGRGRDGSENLDDAGDEEEAPHVRWFDRNFPEEAAGLGREERTRLVRSHGERALAVGPPLPDGARYELDLGGPHDTSWPGAPTERHPFRPPEADGPPGPSTDPGAPREPDPSVESPERRPQPTSSEEESAAAALDAVFTFDGQRLPLHTGTGPDHDTDLPADQDTLSEASTPDPDALRDMRLRLERLRSSTPAPSEGDRPSPVDTGLTGDHGRQDPPDRTDRGSGERPAPRRPQPRERPAPSTDPDRSEWDNRLRAMHDWRANWKHRARTPEEGDRLRQEWRARWSLPATTGPSGSGPLRHGADPFGGRAAQSPPDRAQSPGAPGSRPVPPAGPEPAGEDRRPPAPTGTDPGADGRSPDRATAQPARPEPGETPGAPFRSDSGTPGGEGFPALPQQQTVVPPPGAAPPPVEQEPLTSAPVSDLFAFFEQELNGSVDSGDGDSAQDDGRTPSGEGTTAEPAPVLDDGRGLEAADPETGPGESGPVPARRQPHDEDQDASENEDGNERDIEEDAGDVPGDGNGPEDDGEDGSRDEDGSDGSGDRSGGDRGGDSHGDGGRSGGGGDRFDGRGGSGAGRGPEGEVGGSSGDGGRSSHGDGRGRRDTRDGRTPDQRDADTGPVAHPDPNPHDGDGGMSLYGHPDTPA